MIATIILVEDVRGFSAIFDVLILGVALAVAAVPEGLAGGRDGGAVARRAAHGQAQRHRAPPRRRRDARLGERHRLRQDRHAHQERDDGARGRHGERACQLRRHGLRAGGRRAAATAAGRSTARSSSSSMRALAAADRANNAVLQERDGRWTVQGDPTEGALIVAARKAGLEADALDARFARVAEVPFSSERKLMSTIHTRRRAARSACSSSPRARRTCCSPAARRSWSARRRRR